MAAGVRWVAVQVHGIIFITVHFPHLGSGLDEYAKLIDEISIFFRNERRNQPICIGMDANIAMDHFRDDKHVGPHVLHTETERDELRR
eukprot:4832925-Prorocentrum_lima.AAC.1